VAAKSVLTVTATAPETRIWPVTIPAGGWLAPWQEAVIASETGGLRITHVLADVGDLVKQGQPLALLAQETVLADIRRQKAALDAAEARHAIAQTNAARARRLHPSGAQTEQHYDEVIHAEKDAAAALDLARAELEIQRIRLRQTTIAAPDDGVVSMRSATLGGIAGAGAELFRLIRRQRIEWHAEVGARHTPSLQPGQAAALTLPGGTTLAGTIRAIAPAAAKDTARTLVYVELPQAAGAQAGVYAAGGIILENTPALTVPETALIVRDGLCYLFTLPPDNNNNDNNGSTTNNGSDTTTTSNNNNNAQVTRVRVETGRRRDGRVEITKGLAAGARVVRSGGAFLADGATVTIAAR
jgi:RND family efflux transporter MFP subunit